MEERNWLDEYSRTGSNAAFEKLVGRYVDLVYSAAKRQLRDPHGAEDVVQAVFIVLAKKAAALPRSVVLAAWLLETTRLAALDVQRQNARRADRERNAAIMATTNNSPTEDHWPQIAPHLDEALTQLSASDRNAIVLRYIENRSLREVGATLGVSESAADKRVSRALERIRQFFTKRGVVLSAAVIATTLPVHAVHAAPAGMAAAIPGALATAKAGLVVTTASTTAENAIRAMSFAKAKVAALWSAAALIIGAVGLFCVESLLKDSTPVENAARTEIPDVQPQMVAIPIRKTEPERERIYTPPTAAAATTTENALKNLPLREPTTDRFIDLTAAIDPDADTVIGDWKREGGALKSDLSFFAGIEVPYIPPAEYDLRVTFTPIKARDTVAIVLTRGQLAIPWKMGAYGNQACMFEVANQPWPHNPTAFRQKQILKTGETMTCVAEVRNGGIKMYLNERLVCDFPTDYTNVGPLGFWKPNHNGVLGLASWSSPTYFSKIEIAEITGEGRWLRAPDEPVARPAKTPLPTEEQWAAAARLLSKVKVNRDIYEGAWTHLNGTVECESTDHARLTLPFQVPDEYDLRVRLTRRTGDGEVAIIMPRKNQFAAWKMFMDDWVCGFAAFDDTTKVNRTCSHMPDGDDAAVWTVVLRVRRESISVYLNGMLMSKLTDDLTKLTAPPVWQLADPRCIGLGSNRNHVIFHSAELIPVTGELKEILPKNSTIRAPERF